MPHVFFSLIQMITFSDFQLFIIWNTCLKNLNFINFINPLYVSMIWLHKHITWGHDFTPTPRQKKNYLLFILLMFFFN